MTKDPAPDAAFETKQQLDHLQGAFGGLSETHHQILVMRELEGLSYREIGERLGMTRPAVESTLFRARRRLTEEYEELVTGERCQRVQAIIADCGTDSALGARDRKRLALHVSYCQPCLRHARVSGLDSDLLVHRPMRAKVAALLPLPAFLRKRWGGEDAVAGAPDHSALASWSMQVGTVDPSLVSGWSKAAATAATIAIAGVGAGVATQPGSVTSAFGGGSLAERLGGGSDDDALQRAQGAKLATASVSGASLAGAGTASARRSSAVGSSSRGASSTRSSSEGGRSDDRPASKGTGGKAGAGSSTSAAGVTVSETPGTKQPAADDDPIRRVLPGGGGAGGSSGSSTSGGSGGVLPSSGGAPPVQLPAGNDLPDPTGVIGGATGGGTAGGAASDGKSENPVGDAVDGATDAVQGVLGGGS